MKLNHQVNLESPSAFSTKTSKKDTYGQAPPGTPGLEQNPPAWLLRVLLDEVSELHQPVEVRHEIRPPVPEIHDGVLKPAPRKKRTCGGSFYQAMGW